MHDGALNVRLLRISRVLLHRSFSFSFPSFFFFFFEKKIENAPSEKVSLCTSARGKGKAKVRSSLAEERGPHERRVASKDGRVFNRADTDFLSTR